MHAIHVWIEQEINGRWFICAEYHYESDQPTPRLVASITTDMNPEQIETALGNSAGEATEHHDTESAARAYALRNLQIMGLV